tara:strand:+ start:5183 stop:5323 length:141 start_codon:yes stop_codon:yes gene_type:complete
MAKQPNKPTQKPTRPTHTPRPGASPSGNPLKRGAGGGNRPPKTKNS